MGQDGRPDAERARALSLLHRETLQREREAWARLQAPAVAGRDAQRHADLLKWTQAMNELRKAQAELTRALADQAASDLRASSQALTTVWVAPTSPGGSGTRRDDSPEALGFAPPTRGQRLRSRDGTVWLVMGLTVDALEPGFFLVQLEAEPGSGPSAGNRARELEVYSEDWPLLVIAQGWVVLP